MAMVDAPGGSTTWESISTGVLSAFASSSSGSPTISRAVARGVRFIVPDAARKELVFDKRALVLGLLAAGLEDRAAFRSGNTARWFTDWAIRKAGAARVAQAVAPSAMASETEVSEARTAGHRIVASASLQGILPQAAKLAVATVKRSECDARHLFAATLQSTAFDQLIEQEIGFRPTAADLAGMKAELVARLLPTAESGETKSAWCAALGVTEAQVDAVPPPPPDAMPAYNSDHVRDATADLLDVTEDAQALARLICLDGAAPLAVAIFGDWGSGKSTFMAQLDKAVEGLVGKDTADDPAVTSAPADGSGVSRFVERVVQIRFNAWQFVDANLWASLTSEFFDQLRAGGHDPEGKIRHAGLVERVNRHVHALTAELDAQRRAAAEGGRDLLIAQRERDEAAKTVREAFGNTPGQAEVDALGDVFEAQRKDLAALGLAIGGEKGGEAVDAILDAITSARSLPGQLAAAVRVTRASPSRSRVLAAAGLLLMGALSWWYIKQPPATEALAPALAALTSLGLAIGAAAPALRIVSRLAGRSADLAAKVEAADRDQLKAVVQSEIALRDAAAEAEALQAAVTQGAQRLARYVSPDAVANPPRLLHYVLEDDPNSKALQAEIGLIGRTRRLFQAVDDIARQERKKRAEGQPYDSTVPDRIILYIDDLDRCTEEQVYNVLQAIHLLLAFEMFVVVVGVDVTRVEDALTRALQPRVASRAERLRARQVAVRYLEKIFQIAFWLAPLSGEADASASYARYVKALAGRGLDDPALRGAGQGGGANGQPGGPDAADAPAPEAARNDPEPERLRALATIQLDDLEVEFLASPQIGAIAATTPRAVKRLVNVYRLIRTRLADDPELSILGGRGRQALFPLAALMAAIETGPDLEVAEAFYDGVLALPDGGLAPPPPPRPAAAGKPPQAPDPNTLAGFPKAFALSPKLRDAVETAFAKRNNNVSARELKAVAKIARRYSFHSYRDLPRPLPDEGARP